MKRITGLLILIGLLMISCNDDTGEMPQLVNGTYNGNFSRLSPNGDWISSNVTLEFNNNSFQGESDLEKYPAICTGTYTLNGSEIDFDNQCSWTAEFDWTFILAGEFEVKVVGTELTLTRKYDEHTFDQYILTRQY